MTKRNSKKIVIPSTLTPLAKELDRKATSDLGTEITEILDRYFSSEEEGGGEDSSRSILMFAGDIGESSRSLISTLLMLHYDTSYNDPVTLLINSDGGDASVGWAIIDVMNFIRLPVHTVALGYVCSMAADIFVNGDHRTMGEHSTLMIHPHSGGAIGDHHRLIAAQRGDQIEHARRIGHYLANSKYKTEVEINANLLGVLGGDVYLTPEDVLEHGLCDEIAKTSENKRYKRHPLVPPGSPTSVARPKARKSPTKKSPKRTRKS